MTEPGFSRRAFIRTFAGGTLGGMVLYAFPEEARAKYIVANDQIVNPADDQFWQVVRQQFPLKHEPVFLNNGTIGPSPYVVIDAVRAEMEDVDRTGRYGGWDDVRPKIAKFIHASPDEVSLTHNVTEGINIVACGLPLKRGDEVIMTNHEHAGNAIPWLARARRDGIVVRPVTLAATAAEILNRIDAAITKRTRVIAVPHITCTTGQILPAREITRLGHDKGLWVMLDAAHTPGMMPVDVNELGCDFLATCGHKWMMGPKGTGFLYVRKDLFDVLEPTWSGGGAAESLDIFKGTLVYRHDAHRYDFASQNSAIFVGLGAAIDFLLQIGIQNVERRGKSLASRLRNGLKALDERVEILTPDEEGAYGSVIGFRVKALPFDKLQQSLSEKYHMITRGVGENGLNSNRISTHIYNNEAEVDRVLEAITSMA